MIVAKSKGRIRKSNYNNTRAVEKIRIHNQLQKIFNRTVASNHVSGLRAGFNEEEMRIPTEKIRKMRQELKKLSNNKLVSVKKLASLIGLLTSTNMGFSPAFIHQRWMQRNVSEYTKDGNWNKIIPLWDSSKLEIKWWLDNLEKYNGKTTSFNSMQTEIYTDASLTGWGAHSKELQLEQQGLWDYWDAQESSNFRELKTV